MNDLDELNRRDFLGLSLLGPLAVAAAGAIAVDDRPIYRGGMRALISAITPAADWHVRHYALVESVDDPESEWRVSGLNSALGALRRQSGLEPGVMLRSQRIRQYCEVGLSPRPSVPYSPACFANMIVFDDVSACEASWRMLEARIAEERADVRPFGLAEAAYVANDLRGWTLPDMLFFRRANVGVKIHVARPVSGHDADRFATILDRHIAAKVSRGAA